MVSALAQDHCSFEIQVEDNEKPQFAGCEAGKDAGVFPVVSSASLEPGDCICSKAISRRTHGV